MNGSSTDAQAARSWLRRHLASHSEAFKEFLADDTEIRQLILEDAFPYESGPLPREISGVVLPLLLHWAETTIAGHHFLRRIIAGLVRSGEPVPDDWRSFHASVLDGSTVEPPRPKGRAAANARRNELISLLVTLLQIRFNLPRLANSTSRNGDTALEIVKGELETFFTDLQMVEIDALEKALKRQGERASEDPILSVIDRRT